MKAKVSSTTREQPKADNYLARVVGLTDLGIQPGFMWQGEMTRDAAKLEITYELVTNDMSDGRPFWVSESGTNSLTSKWLTSRCMATNTPMEALEQMLNKPVLVTVAVNEKGYPKITNVAGVPSGMPVPELRNPTQLFDLEDPDMEVWNKFPDFKKDKIKEAKNFKETQLYTQLFEFEVDDIPF